MRSIKRIISLTAILTVLVGCSQIITTHRHPIPSVISILQQPQSHHYTLISEFNPNSSNGAICIYGDVDASLALSAYMASFDAFDNIDGRRIADHLPDFAGERIQCLKDSAAVPYNPYVLAGDLLDLREESLGCAIAALDTVCFWSRYSELIPNSKMGAKILVIADPYLTAYGHYDIDTLFKAVGAPIPLYSSSYSALDYAKEKGCRNVGIAALGDELECGIYDSLLVYHSMMYGESGISLHAHCDTSATRWGLRKWLDEYRNEGNSDKLDILIVDNPVSDSDLMLYELEEIRSMLTQEDYEYCQLLSENFTVVHSYALLCERIYRDMRRNNIFTHNVAYPQIDTLYTIPGKEGTIVICTE